MKNKGFTLVELLVGILIFSIVIFTLFSSFEAFVSSGRAVNQDILRNEGIKQALTRITMDLDALFIVQPPRYSKPEFNSDPDPYCFLLSSVDQGVETVSDLTFSSVAHVSSNSESKRSLARIRYFVAQDKQGYLNLYRSDILQSLGEQKDNCFAPILCKNILGFEVKCIAANGDESAYWDSDSDEFNYTVPRQVALKINYETNNHSQVFQTTVFIASSRAAIE